jgi:serine/threonine protein kinase
MAAGAEGAGCPSVEDLMAFALGKLEPGPLLAVHVHLDACDVCQRVLTAAAHALATAVTVGQPTRSEVDWNTTFQRGAIVGGRYEIREFIARGGMGEVYEAFDRELRERVALKTVTSTACDNARAVRRLKGEVQLARRVSHPSVCRIYDFGRHVLAGTGTQLHFLTMEFVQGETLGQRLRLAGALPEAEAHRLARELLLALRAAHEAGVLHRDFKSDNVMLKAGPDGQSTAVVLDFGLARALDHDEAASVSSPQLVGTFGYMAPEQLDGRPHTTASDVYSFGVVWFEMLTGELPFRTASFPTAAAPRSLGRSAAPPSSINPQVSRAVDALVLRCLEQTPAARYQTVGDVLAALDRLAVSAPASGRRRWFLPGALAAAVTASLASPWLLPHFVVRTPTLAKVTGTHAPHEAHEAPAPPPVRREGTETPPVAAALERITTAATGAAPQLAKPAATPRHRAVPERRQGAEARPTPPEISAPPSEPRVLPDPAPETSAGTAESQLPASTASAPRPALPSSSRPRKPNWENPFGAKETPQLVAREPTAP